ncbi:copper resistance CopC family protein [Cryobacterium sp. BB736]|uniref:copper resistance CopC family protein n=1 Tax=Cryobacterium sp. BB736 TaxID=2746963 RepID=UPI00187611E7
MKRKNLMAAGAVAAIALLGLAGPASAHNAVISTTPSDDQVLTELPARFEIRTSDDLLPAGAAIMQVTDADGLFYGDGCVVVEGPSASSVPELGAPGDYTLDWQVVSADGHTISGTIPFSWAPAAPDAPISEGRATAPVCGEEPAAAPEQTSDATDTPLPTDNGDDAETVADSGPPWGLLLGGVLGLGAIGALIAVLVHRAKSAPKG